MNKLIALLALFLSLFFVSFNVKEEYFTGKIVYEHTFRSLKDSSITHAYDKEMGTRQLYFINANNYKAYYENGELMQLFNNKDYRYYFHNMGAKDVYIMDANQNRGPSQIIYNKETETICGYECKSLTMKKDGKQTTYFYSDKVRVNIEPFKNHWLGNWNEYLKATNGALALKFIAETDSYYWIATASAVEQLSLSEKDFDVKKETKGLRN